MKKYDEYLPAELVKGFAHGVLGITEMKERIRSWKQRILNAPRSVLFIGNSYTYCNDLPSLFGELARSRGYELQVRSVKGRAYAGSDTPTLWRTNAAPSRSAFLQSERFTPFSSQEFSVRPALTTNALFQRRADAVRGCGGRATYASCSTRHGGSRAKRWTRTADDEPR